MVRSLDARLLFDTIAEAAWACGDPGLLFLDEINRHNPTPLLGPLEATNPCGEQPLLPYESCVLGSLNLAVFVGAADLDWARSEEAIRDAVVLFLDNVIEATEHPFPPIRAATLRTRRIGLGVMGPGRVLRPPGRGLRSCRRPRPGEPDCGVPEPPGPNFHCLGRAGCGSWPADS